jgi:hypothetical protein
MTMSSGRDGAFGWIATHAALAACALALSAVAASAQEVTFARDVAPILYESCVECHREGSFAPMSLLTYEQARRFASAIRYRVSNRQMPPWHVDQTLGVQRFANDVSLTDEEIGTIVAWVDAGAPRGDDGDLPPPPVLPEGGSWQLEEILGRAPDVIIRTSPYSVEAQGPERLEFQLTSGSLLLMKAPMQKYYLHGLPKTAKPVQPRLNLTFRHILSGS